MTVPDWRTSQAGTRVRAALWLHGEIGVSGTFTKAQLREAFPGVEQIDRRVRDLRPEGWVIATYREDPSLGADELRLVAEGGPVWEKGYKSRQEQRPSDQTRRTVFAADNFACAYCGVAGGETYPDDDLRSAKLSASLVRSSDSGSVALITLCDRCRAGTGAAGEITDNSLGAEIEALLPEERRLLSKWITAGARDWSLTERLWSRYRRLPATQRDQIRREI
jgi:hypothetical protein